MRLYRRPPISDGAPAPTMTLTPVEGMAIACRGKSLAAASTHALRLAEGSYPEVIYFPADHVDPSAHQPVTGETHCPWKGEANYFAVHGAARAAWTYYEATDPVADISGMIAYDPAYIDVDIIALPTVPEAAETILHFWLLETPPAQHFKSDPEFDQELRTRFGDLHAQAASGALDDWQKTPRGTLALLILLDQFSRNIYRDRAEAFATDKKAQTIADRLVSAGWDLSLDPSARAFAYLPFMHAEDMAQQNRSVELFSSRLPASSNVGYAIGHRKTFHQHGRFPGRDAALGR